MSHRKKIKNKYTLTIIFTSEFCNMKQKKTLLESKKYHLETFALFVFTFLCIDLWTKNFFYNTDSGVLNAGAIRWLAIPSWISVIVWILLILFLFFLDQKKPLSIFSTSLLVAGIVGNTYDRLLFHGVRDWISLQDLCNFHQIFWFQFPVFNVADLCLFLGICLFIIQLSKNTKKWENFYTK